MTSHDVDALDADAVVHFLGDIFERRGGEEYLGEEVTMAEHMLQAAALAEQAGEDEAVVVAALLHDIGHFTSEFGMFSMNDVKDRHHEDAGADVLARLLPPQIVDCVRHHVMAKRYLCSVDPAYFDQLSAASVHSLMLQGGRLEGDERIAFARNAHLLAMLRVRRYDDAAKVADLAVPPFAHYADAIRHQVDTFRNGGQADNTGATKSSA